MLNMAKPGLLNILYFRKALKSKPLADDEIAVEVHAISVNFQDCLTVLGCID